MSLNQLTNSSMTYDPTLYVSEIATRQGTDFLCGGWGSNGSATGPLPQSTTTGFIHIPCCSTAPAGVPALINAGTVPLVFDTTGDRIWIYTSGAWHYSALT